ncbi:MAG: enolase C-terminal domain-like protein [Synechococcaceae cyanobacterium]|nr:enolase C-terminal domain-like protein [Synechococcaceae cyanobacterium]
MSPVLRLAWRPWAFRLARPLRTARGTLEVRQGWLLRLEAPDGRVGWGEAAPLAADPAPLGRSLAALGREPSRAALEGALPALAPALAFALGAALAEIEGLVGAGGWRPAPPPALLLPAGGAALPALESVLALEGVADPGGWAEPTVKWKVAAGPDTRERRLLEELLERLPAGARLRLDANGGWDRETAASWAERLAGEPRLQWLEQPLPPEDLEGLRRLAERLPVALDESLAQRPELRERWEGWQVRRPSQEGDPRPLLADLQAGRPRLALSTAFETGIGARWLAHLAALQAAGPTPAAPGLAPGWCPGGPLFAADPLRVWEAAG